MKKQCLIIILFLFSINLNAQFCKRDFLEQQCLYPIKNKKEIFEKVDTFLCMLSTLDSNCIRFVIEDDMVKWGFPFREIMYYLQTPKEYTPTIVGIMDFTPNEYTVKIQFTHHPDSTTQSLLGIYNLIVIHDPKTDTYKFQDFRTYYMKNYLDSLKVGHILYYKKKGIKLNRKKCKEFNKFNNKIAGIFEVPRKDIAYFSFKNSIETMNFMGWDIIINMFFGPTGGFANYGTPGTPFENQIYSGNNSEIYEHELVHYYVNSLMTCDTCWTTRILSEGIPTYFGGSSGLKYMELKQNLAKFLEGNDTVTINKNFNDPIKIDKKTDYVYAMGAFIAELYYKKDKLAGLKKVANYTDDNFIKNMSLDFGVKEEELDTYLRKEIRK